MKRLIIFLLLFAAIKVAGQTTGYLRFDTVRIMKQNGTCELYIINKTKDSLGILTNVGGGLTQFRKSRVLNDSTIVVGLDTLVISGGGGGGAGSVTSITQGYGIVATPNPITSTGTIRADTSGTNGLVTRTELLDSTDITTQVQSPIYVKLRASWSVPDTLAIDTTVAATRGRLYKVADSLIAMMATAGVPNTNSDADFRWLIPSSQAIKTAANSSTITWDSTSNANSLTAKVDTSAIATPNYVNNSGRTYPDESSNEIILLEQSSWTGADLGAQFSRGANHTLSLNGTFPRLASSTIVWGGASLTRFLPNLPIIAIYDKIEVDYQIVSALASNVGFGPSFYSNNVNGANFGYTTYLSASSTTGTPHFAKQDGTSDQTGTTFTIAVNDVIRQTIEFRDTVAIATFQNLTTGSAVSTITKSFVAGTAPYPPNTGTWGFQNFSGTYEIRRVKITTRKTMSPTLMVAFDSKGQIIASPWVARFPSLLNARYPSVLNYSGGGDQLKDLIDKKIEFSRINPEQVLIGLGSNDLRYGSSLTTTLDRVARVVKMVSGSTTRWAITVVPEDSTAGGIGLTAFKNNIASAYPSNYIDLWTISSTSNVLKSVYNSGDGVHPNTEWNRIADSVIAASGFFSVQSPNRRSPYQKFGGGIWATGDSLYGPFKTPLPINSVLRMNDSSQVTHSLAFDNGAKFTISANYPHAQTVAGTTLLQVDGLFSNTGNTAGFQLYDRSNTSNFHFIYSNNNHLRFNYNGTDNIYVNTIGAIKLGVAVSETVTGMFQIRKNVTLPATQGVLGVGFNLDTATHVLPNAGNAFYTYASIAPSTLTATSSGSVTDAASLYIGTAPIAGTNFVITNPWALYINSGRTRLGTVDSVTTATGGYLFKDFATGAIKMTAAPSGGGGSISGSGTSGRVAYWNGGSSITSDANFLYSASDAGILSLGTTNTQGHFNIGGNKNFGSSGPQMYLAAATYTDIATAASGTISWSINLIGSPTIAASNTGVLVNASTLHVQPPLAGTNVTLNTPPLAITTEGAVRIGGGLQRTLTGETSGTTIDHMRDIVTCSAAGGAYTITLPDATKYSGFTFTFKRTDNSGNTCTVGTTSSQTIDGSTTFSLTAQYKYVTVVSNGSNWLIISQN